MNTIKWKYVIKVDLYIMHDLHSNKCVYLN